MADAHGGGGGGGLSDVIFIMLVLGFMVALFFFSGAAKRANINTIFIPFPGQQLATGTYPTIGVPGVTGISQSSVGGVQSGAQSAETNTITGEIAAVNKDVASLKNVPNSPYAGKVSIASSWSGRASDPRGEYVMLRASPTNKTPITITGWRLESAVSERVAYIRNGTEVYQQGLGNAGDGPIVLNPGDTAIITTGRSPIGTSFRVNKCSGYLTQFQTFTPPLFTQCPQPQDELNTVQNKELFSDNQCYDHLTTIGSCKIDLSPPAKLSPLCKEFIYSRITYQGCVISHRFDSDFKSKEWRVYLSYDYSLWRDKREAIALIDENGKVVDSVIY